MSLLVQEASLYKELKQGTSSARLCFEADTGIKQQPFPHLLILKCLQLKIIPMLW